MKKNLRYLTTTLAVTSFLACPSSYALSIGGMKLQSALNQNLKAEIALILSEGENSADLKIGLASNARFDEAGIPWTLFLSKIKFQTVTQNGETTIKLSSNEVLKEPFLDFLVEVRSAKSTAYREFTVLVDPPADYKSTQPTVILKEDSANSSRRFVSVPTTMDSDSYGPIRESETLWSIASKFSQQNNISVNEMVTAIYSANPDAFRGSADAMIAGMVLKIPNVGESATIKTKPQKVAVVKEKTVTIASNSSANTTTIIKPPKKIESSVMDQKLSELERQLSEMKKTIADQNAQIAALKASTLIGEVPKSSVIEPPVSVVVLPVKPPELPVTVIPPVVIPQVTEPTAVAPVEVVPPIAVIPTPAATPSASTIPSLSTEKLDSPPYSSIPAGSYYYVAGAAGLLLLSLLGWLRLRNQNKVVVDDSLVEPEGIIDGNPADEIKIAVENELNQIDDSVFNIFDNDTTTSNVENESERKTEYEGFDDADTKAEADFEKQSLSEFNRFMGNDSGKYNSGDLLYKVDVYCAYGDYDKAILLLHDEFTKHPEADDYALRLLKLYVLQGNKAGFVEFIFELTKLGKKETPEFWMQVSDIADDFYPEALSFTSSPAIHDSSLDIASSDMFTKVDSNEAMSSDIMNFDEAVSSGIDVELNVEELLTKATADFFNSPVQFDDEEDDLEPMKLEEEFLFDEFKLESSPFDLDFTTFEVEEPAIKEPKIEPAFDLDFTTFEVEEPAIKEPKIESAFDLDFKTFEVEESAIKEPKIEPAFDLDFTTFEVEEPAIKEPKIESAFDLDFTTFEVEEPVIKEPKIESAFDLDFTIEKAHLDLSERHEAKNAKNAQ